MTVVTWPIRPSPVMTGWPTRTPRPLPWSMKIVEYQSVGDCPMTRAVTGFVPASVLVRSIASSPSSWRFWRTASVPAIARRRRSAFWFFRSETWPLASTVSPNQPTRSRAGLSARLAPSWIGETTSRTPRWTLCSPPPADSPK